MVKFSQSVLDKQEKSVRQTKNVHVRFGMWIYKTHPQNTLNNLEVFLAIILLDVRKMITSIS